MVTHESSRGGIHIKKEGALKIAGKLVTFQKPPIFLYEMIGTVERARQQKWLLKLTRLRETSFYHSVSLLTAKYARKPGSL